MMKRTLLSIAIVALSMVMSLNLVAQPSRGAVLPVGKKITIQSFVHKGRSNQGYWELPGGKSSAKKGDNLRVWALDNAPTKRFTLVRSKQNGYYEIYPANDRNLRVDVAGGRTDNGTNVGIWDANYSEAQRFLFKHLGGGRYKIYTPKGTIVNLKSQSAANGTNVQVWRDHNGAHNEWYLLDTRGNVILPEGENAVGDVPVKGDKAPEGAYLIQSAMSKDRNPTQGFLQFPKDDSRKWKKKGNKTEISYKTYPKDSRTFNFYKPKDQAYYVIHMAWDSDFALDIAGGKTTKGTPVHGWTTNSKNPNQHFYLKHLGNGRYKIYHKSGKVVCLKDNKKDSDGNPVHLWDDHNGLSTEWFFINEETGKVYVP